jgi:hypothetical protein
MSKKQTSPKFQIGDRVAEKPKPRAIYAKTAATIERIKPYTVQRYGTVLDTVYQGARGKALCALRQDHMGWCANTSNPRTVPHLFRKRSNSSDH